MIEPDSVEQVNTGDPITAEWANNLVNKLNNTSELTGSNLLNSPKKAFENLFEESSIPPNVAVCKTPRVDTTTYEQWAYQPNPFEICSLRVIGDDPGFVAEPPSGDINERLGVLLGGVEGDTVPVIISGEAIAFSNETLVSGDYVTATDATTISPIVKNGSGRIQVMGELDIGNDLEAKLISDAFPTYTPYKVLLDRQMEKGSTMAIANEAMNADWESGTGDTYLYNVDLIWPDGLSRNTTIQAARLPGHHVRSGDRGHIIYESETGVPIFWPINQSGVLVKALKDMSADYDGTVSTMYDVEILKADGSGSGVTINAARVPGNSKSAQPSQIGFVVMGQTLIDTTNFDNIYGSIPMFWPLYEEDTMPAVANEDMDKDWVINDNSTLYEVTFLSSQGQSNGTGNVARFPGVDVKSGDDGLVFKNFVDGVHVFMPSNLYKDEDAQDAIATMLTEGDGIDFVYDDPADTFTISVDYNAPLGISSTTLVLNSDNTLGVTSGNLGIDHLGFEDLSAPTVNTVMYWDGSNLDWIPDPGADSIFAWDETSNAVAWMGIDPTLAIDSTSGDLRLDHLGIENLVDPNADKYIMWDNSVGEMVWVDDASGLPDFPNDTRLLAYSVIEDDWHWYNLQSSGAIVVTTLADSYDLSINTHSTLSNAMGTNSDELGLEHLGIEDLVDPNLDGIMFWDDSAGSVEWLSPYNGIEISGNSIGVKTDSTLNNTLGANSDELGLNHLGIENLTDPDADKYMMWDDSEGEMVWVDSTEGDDVVKVTSNDTNSDYLANKVVGGTGVDVSEKNDGTDEDLEVALDLTDITGYDGTAEQVLVNDNGTFKWVSLSDFSCP